MRPLKSEAQDTNTLQELGRASAQIVHDLKNQLNGLKLYATFLRKRMEKSERPADERETIDKLITGLERAAADLTALVRYGRPVELRRQPGIDLFKILTEVTTGEGFEGVNLKPKTGPLEGEFDAAAITEALKAITAGALNMRRAGDRPALEIRLRRDVDGGAPWAVIEWHGIQSTVDQDPFHSFAGSDALRMSLAAKIIEAHGGEVGQGPGTLSVRLPLKVVDG